ncbi:DUF6126 family protein [Streptomyces sp. NBC_01217]|uniref:DUF6126 family protein n=1 Tax=Streptomyces sp. NBC_01217 TaxID=2903779 RepID=UPI002E0DECB4|nr:DUF6126 family protein [Streptomyces sp. NBC_01217]
MSDSENFDPLGSKKKYEAQEGRFPRGVVIRLVAYLVAGHVFAAFLYLLFEVAGKG